MRVIAGIKRGMKLHTLEGNDTRPTLDRVKEAVFSMLMPMISESSVLDLFAGSGALGIESLSRGAASAVFVDNSSEALSYVKKNIQQAGFNEVSTVLNMDAETFLTQNNRQFDIIFMDPPYNSAIYTSALNLIATTNALSVGGVIILEWDSGNEAPVFPEQFTVLKERKYGRVQISVLELKS